jgi:ADP-heptose:LPS heptosyltransferase
LRNSLRGLLAQRYLDLANATLHAAARLLFHRDRPEDPARIIVFRVGNIGDTITAVPALAGLRQRFPRAHITFLTSPGDDRLAGARELLRDSDLFDEMIRYTNEDISTWKGRLQLRQRLLLFRADLFVELTHNQASYRAAFRNLLFARSLGVHRVVFGDLVTPPFWRQHHTPAIMHEQDAVRTWHILRPLGLNADEHLEFPLPEPSWAIAEAEQVVKGLRRTIVALCPGGKRAINRWPTERFAEVACQLQQNHAISLIIVGGPGDKDLAEAIRKGCPNTVDATGMELLATKVLLRRCALLVTNDTGPMHLAAAVGTPVVAVFSARDYPIKWYPYGSGHVVFRRDVSCACCFLENCPTMHCTREITVAEVVAASEAALRRAQENDVGR